MKTPELVKPEAVDPKVSNIWDVLEGTEGAVRRPLLEQAVGSAIALDALHLPPGSEQIIDMPFHDSILVVLDGELEVELSPERRHQAAGSVTFVEAGRKAVLSTQGSGATLVQFLVETAKADSHASLGPAELFSSIDLSDSQSATSNRKFGVIFGPENGSNHGTLFAGLVPVGAAPWHFHQYEEIVLILEGTGRFHHGDTVSPVRYGSAFHIPARDLHINENTTVDQDVLLLGFLTPAGSPSAAYLPKP